MTNNIHVNSDSVISIVGATIKGIENIQEDVNDAYSSLIDLLSDASGEEVDALREQLETENNLAIALCNTLTKFSNSIRLLLLNLQNWIPQELVRWEINKKRGGIE